jgi:glucose/arabinose dehydrogenase
MGVACNMATVGARPRRRRRTTVAVVTVALVAAVLAVIEGTGSKPAGALWVPNGFQDEVMISGLHNPTVVQFGPDGRVWVAEKSGIIKVYPAVGNQNGTVFADLRPQVHNWWDRGLLGLVLDPQFPTRPYVYVQYTYNHLGWPTLDGTGDDCPNPPGGTDDGCVALGRISRLTVSGGGAGNTMVAGSEVVLVEDWCIQYPSHSVGTLVFGPDGKLYAGGGDGASFTLPDLGQLGGTRPNTTNPVTRRNPCNNGPNESGAMRAQSVRTPATSQAPSTLDGTIIRINPDGTVPADNPFALAGRTDAKERMTIAYGLRNPFRFAFRPGTHELWIGDVGWNDWEEIHSIPDVRSPNARNFGWPCLEGSGPNWGYVGMNPPMCAGINGSNTALPDYAYDHFNPVAPNDGCGVYVTDASGKKRWASAITGVTFYPETGAFPPAYRGGLFFADYSRGCIYFLPKGANGRPTGPAQLFANLRNSSSDENGAVDLVIGPDGNDLWWVDLFDGKIHRIRYTANNPPEPAISASPTSGAVPLEVSFSAAGSVDPDGHLPLSYAWDFDGNGTDDGWGLNVSHTYVTPGPRTVRLRVTDNLGASATRTVLVQPGAPPTPTINTPTAGTTWKVGDTINFSGSATDAIDGNLGWSSLKWTITLYTCDAGGQNCLIRFQKTVNGASGSYDAPDWGGAGNNVLEFALTATNSAGLESRVTRRLIPQTAPLTILSEPPGLTVSLGSDAVVTPHTANVIVGSTNSVSARSQGAYTFVGWSNGGEPGQLVTTPAGGLTLTARFTAPAGAPPPSAVQGSTQYSPALIAWFTQILIHRYVTALINARKAEAARKAAARRAAARKRATRKSATRKSTRKAPVRRTTTTRR